MTSLRSKKTNKVSERGGLPRTYRGIKKMKKAILAAALMVAANAYAAQTNNGCQGNCPANGGGGNATGGNGYATGIGIGVGGQGGAGGQGGQGGAGGSAAAIGQGGSGGTGGAGGSVVGSGNSANANYQGQGQHQVANGGNSNQSQSSRNDNRSNAANTNSNANSGNNSAQTTRVEGDTYVSVYRAAANTAYAPPIAPTALCMGSSSAGGTGMTFGFSIGTSWTDENCMLLEQVRTVAVVLADKETAAAMMCSVEAYRAAREKSGKPC